MRRARSAARRADGRGDRAPRRPDAAAGRASGGRCRDRSRRCASTTRRQAATWERQALIKARPVAGRWQSSVPRSSRPVAPFVFPEELARADDRRGPPREGPARGVRPRVGQGGRSRSSAGHGGIRDVEFAVQLLQIVHGRRDERLREPNTLRALAALADEGYVGRDDAGALADAYRFLRTLEHRLQIVRDLQTHELPADRASRTVLARSLGMDGSGRAARRVRAADRAWSARLHERLFYRPLLESFAGPRRRVRAGTARRRRSCSPGSGSAGRLRRTRCSPGSSTRRRASGRCSPTCSRSWRRRSRSQPIRMRRSSVSSGWSRRARATSASRTRSRTTRATARRLAHVVAAQLVRDGPARRARPERVLALQGGAEPDDAQAALVAVAARYAARELAAEPRPGRASGRRSRTGSSGTRSRPPSPTCRSR